MTREELKEHCKRQVQRFERIEKLMPVTPNDWKRYEEHKLILELLEQEPFINKPCVSEKACEHDKNVVLGKIRAEIGLKEKTLTDKYGQQKYGIWTHDVLQIIDKYKGESEETNE